MVFLGIYQRNKSTSMWLKKFQCWKNESTTVEKREKRRGGGGGIGCEHDTLPTQSDPIGFSKSKQTCDTHNNKTPLGPKDPNTEWVWFESGYLEHINRWSQPIMVAIRSAVYPRGAVHAELAWQEHRGASCVWKWSSPCCGCCFTQMCTTPHLGGSAYGI